VRVSKTSIFILVLAAVMTLTGGTIVVFGAIFEDQLSVLVGLLWICFCAFVAGEAWNSRYE
jgi:hypothetical protein